MLLSASLNKSLENRFKSQPGSCSISSQILLPHKFVFLLTSQCICNFYLFSHHIISIFHVTTNLHNCHITTKFFYFIFHCHEHFRAYSILHFLFSFTNDTSPDSCNKMQTIQKWTDLPPCSSWQWPPASHGPSSTSSLLPYTHIDI